MKCNKNISHKVKVLVFDENSQEKTINYYCKLTPEAIIIGYYSVKVMLVAVHIMLRERSLVRLSAFIQIKHNKAVNSFIIQNTGKCK